MVEKWKVFDSPCQMQTFGTFFFPGSILVKNILLFYFQWRNSSGLELLIRMIILRKYFKPIVVDEYDISL